MDRDQHKVSFCLGYLALVFGAILLLRQLLVANLQPARISYTDFRAAVVAAKVDDVAVGPTRIHGHLKVPEAGDIPHADYGEGDPAKRNAVVDTIRVDDPNLMRDLAAHGVKVTGVAETEVLGDAIGRIIPIAVLGLFAMPMLGRRGQSGYSGVTAVGRSKAKLYMEKDVDARFTDVAGVDEAREELREVIDAWSRPSV